MKKINSLLIGLPLMILSLTSPFSYAQETENSGIEEIIVTARQQNESLQDVPVTIAVMSEQDLERYNITTLDDAAKMVPNMAISQGGSGTVSYTHLTLPTIYSV